MIDLHDYQREAAAIRRARRILRFFAGTGPDEQRRATRMAVAILEDVVEPTE